MYTPPLTYERAEGREGTRLIPGLADALPRVSADGRTYTFRLRRGLRYSDRSPVRASDFAHTVERVRALSARGRRTFRLVSGIRTDDRARTVAIDLERPDPTFPYALASTYAGMVPRRTPLAEAGRRPPPGVGPYRIARSRPERSFSLRRNRRFRLPGIPGGNLDQIALRVVPDLTLQAQDVITGRADSMHDPPPAGLLPEIRSKFGDRYEEHPTLSTYYFFFDTSRRPFADRRVREAVNLALDGPELKRLFVGRLEPGCNFLPPGLPGYERIDPCPYGDRSSLPDLARARRLVEEAGAAGTSVRVWGFAEGRGRALTEYYARALSTIGLRARVRILGRERYLALVGGGRVVAQTGIASWQADTPHPAGFFALLDADPATPVPGRSFGRVVAPELEERVERLRSEPDLGDVVGQWAELDRRVAERAYAAPFGAERWSTFVSERIDLDGCSRFHPVYLNDYSALCIK